MAIAENHVAATSIEEQEPRYPLPVAVHGATRRASAVGCCGCSSQHQAARASGFSWFDISANGPPGPVDELSLYMGAAFSSIPDDDESAARSLYFASWPSDSSTLTETKKKTKTKRNAASQQFVVDWNKPHDPDNPMNWAMRSRWIQVVLVSILTLQAAMASSMPAPAVREIFQQFKTPEGVLSSLVVSIFNLGFVFGPLLAAPMSELYGRCPVYSVSNMLFLACNAACAASPNLGLLLIFRFLSGCAGAAPLSIGGATVADVAPPALRGRAVSVYSLATLLGPVLGPAAGGFLAEFSGWRWIFWALTIMAGALGLVMLLVLRETSVKTLLEKRTRMLQKSTGDSRYTSVLDDGISPGAAFSQAVKRPLRLLVLHPTVLSLSTYAAIIYGYLYLFFATGATVFTDKYAFSAGFSGLAFMGVGIGIIMGTLSASFWGNRLAASLLLREGVREPEYHLPLMAYSVPVIPAGLVLYGWTAEKGFFWLVPMMGSALVGVGVMFVFIPLTLYLVDAFAMQPVSVLAASTIFRSIFGAFIPLAGPPLYHSVGLGWGNTILAALALLLAPMPWVVMKKGQAIRAEYGHLSH